MFFTSQKPLQRTIIQQTLAATMPQNSSIKQYLNMKRFTKDKYCLWIFLVYVALSTVLMGLGFFYGNYKTIGTLVTGNPPINTNITQCPNYINQNYSECINTCQNGSLYLQKVCISSPNTTINSFALNNQISMHNLKYCFNTILWLTIVLLVITALFYSFIICIPKIIYFYILSVFLMLLAFSFYLLKNLEVRASAQPTLIFSGSIYQTDQDSIRYLSYLLLTIYLIIFPLVLFSPKKIRMAVRILARMQAYFRKMLTMHLFTLLTILLAWGLMMIQILLVMCTYTAGTAKTSTDSFFYIYSGFQIAHPAVLILHFIGTYWFFATGISWHKYFVSTSMYLWYFHQNQYLKPVRRGFQKSYQHLGSAALDAILMPVQWFNLIVYSVCKTNNTTQDNQEEEQRYSGCMGCIYSIRNCFISFYFKVNRAGTTSAVVTNTNYFQSNESSANNFAQNNHRFFNIGGTLTIFLTLFCSIFWILIAYIILNSTIYNVKFPPPISSLSLPLGAVLLVGLVIGSLFANLFTVALDTLLFCFILQKRTYSDESKKNTVRQILQTLYYKSQGQKGSSQMIKVQDLQFSDEEQ